MAPHWTSRAAEIVAPARRDDVIVEELDGEVVFVDPRTTRAFHFNETAYAVWKRCDGRTTTRRIAEALVAEYDVSLDQALDDVEQLVVFFALAGLTGASNTP
jgi:hypothetical protein